MPRFAAFTLEDLLQVRACRHYLLGRNVESRANFTGNLGHGKRLSEKWHSLLADELRSYASVAAHKEYPEPGIVLPDILSQLPSSGFHVNEQQLHVTRGLVERGIRFGP